MLLHRELSPAAARAARAACDPAAVSDSQRSYARLTARVAALRSGGGGRLRKAERVRKGRGAAERPSRADGCDRAIAVRLHPSGFFSLVSLALILSPAPAWP